MHAKFVCHYVVRLWHTAIFGSPSNCDKSLYHILHMYVCCHILFYHAIPFSLSSSISNISCDLTRVVWASYDNGCHISKGILHWNFTEIVFSRHEKTKSNKYFDQNRAETMFYTALFTVLLLLLFLLLLCTLCATICRGNFNCFATFIYVLRWLHNSWEIKLVLNLAKNAKCWANKIAKHALDTLQTRLPCVSASLLSPSLPLFLSFSLPLPIPFPPCAVVSVVRFFMLNKLAVLTEMCKKQVKSLFASKRSLN